jgi:undecaprenyl-diphosphatase
MNPEVVINWSSFPSDHATLFLCLAVTLWMVSKRIAIIAICHAVLVVSLPRIFAGVHYPTDILVGAALGCVLRLAAGSEFLRLKIARPLLDSLMRHRSLFYAGLFLWTLETAEMFDSVRGLLHPGLLIFEHAWHTFRIYG